MAEKETQPRRNRKRGQPDSTAGGESNEFEDVIGMMTQDSKPHQTRDVRAKTTTKTKVRGKVGRPPKALAKSKLAKPQLTAKEKALPQMERTKFEATRTLDCLTYRLLQMCLACNSWHVLPLADRIYR